jgi:predicted MFS family arabinose efflux permease
MILKGYGRATGALFLSYMGLANLAGRIVTLTSKLIFHSGNCLIQITIFTMMIAASHAVILFTGSYFGILVGAILSGFSSGLFFPQIPIILLEIYPSELYGAIYSVWNIFLGVGFCLGGYFGGFIRDITSSYDLLFELAIICNSIMAVNFFISGVSCRKICKKKCKNKSIDG